MKTTDRFDVVVIGAGPGGEVLAGRCADAGLHVAIVERELVGGECSYWGCIPSKTLVRPGDALAAARRVPGAAAAVMGGIDVAAAFSRRDEMTSNWMDESATEWLTAKGVEVVRGRGRLAGTRRVDVDGATETARRLSAERAVAIATGSSAVIPGIPGLREARPWTNREATAAKDVPPRLGVIGGGAVGTELAQTFARLGSAVTVLEGGPRLLAREEPFAGDEVERAFVSEGIVVRTGASVKAVEQAGADGPRIMLVDDDRLDVDQILVAAGRRPNTSSLELETVGLESGRPIHVDHTLRAVTQEGAIPWLYAIGDCNGMAPLTHMAKYQGRVGADAIIGRATLATAVTPRVTFTDPQIAAVGMTEAEARSSGYDVLVGRSMLSDVPGAYTQGVGVNGTAQLVIDERRRVLLGATFTGPGVQELVHSATIAIVAEVPIDRLWHAVPSFPTLSEVWLHMLESLGV